MAKETLDDPAEKIFDLICDFQRSFEEVQPRKKALIGVINLVNSICWELERLDPKTKKFYHHYFRNWPTSLDADNLNWIRTDKKCNCPEEIKLIKEELGKANLNDWWLRGKNDDLGMVIKSISLGITLGPVATLEAEAKTDPTILFDDNPDGYAFSDLCPFHDPKKRLDGKTKITVFLPEYEKGNRGIQRVWAKEIFKRAFQELKKEITDRGLTALEKDYKNEGGLILDTIPWESEYHKQSPYLYTVFFRSLNKGLSEDQLKILGAVDSNSSDQLVKDTKLSDKEFKGNTVEKIMSRLETILGNKEFKENTAEKIMSRIETFFYN